MRTYLNLGCGHRFHASWTNVDFVAGPEAVLACDLRQGIPFPAQQFDVVYHSHVLEHFAKSVAPAFLHECYRVLKPGGIIRVAVPNLEGIAILYLEALESASQGEQEWQRNYEWMMLELYDQVTREKSGGEMAVWMGSASAQDRAFFAKRMGGELTRLTNSVPEPYVIPDVLPDSAALSRSTRNPSHLARVFRHLLWLLSHVNWLQPPPKLFFSREARIQRLLGPEYELLQLGRFRRGGEIHLWMYDRYSLACLLTDAGFIGARCYGPAESQILDWTNYHLDTEPDGTAYKPDSLYMEAKRPSA